MKRFESGEALAKEMGISPQYLKQTFDKYNAGAKANKDPFGKKVRSFSFRSMINPERIQVLLFWRLDYE